MLIGTWDKLYLNIHSSYFICLELINPIDASVIPLKR